MNIDEIFNKVIPKKQQGNTITSKKVIRELPDYKLNESQRQDSIQLMDIAKQYMLQSKVKELEKDFYQQFRAGVELMGDHGFSNTYQAAVYSSAGKESGFNPDQVERKSSKDQNQIGKGSFQYTNEKNQPNIRWNDYDNWLKENNLPNTLFNNIQYLIYQTERENERVDRLNNLNNAVDILQKQFPSSIKQFGEGTESYVNQLKRTDDKDPHRNAARKKILQYADNNGIELDNYDELKSMVDSHTWTVPWSDNFESTSKYVVPGGETRKLYKKVDYKNPVPTSVTTEHFVKYYLRPNDNLSNMEARKKLAEVLLPLIRNMRKYNDDYFN